MSDPTESLAAALAAVQTRLPVVGKTETATVQTKQGGSYKYSYADLADVSRAILPLLGEVGLSWVTKPTFNEAGKFVLAYKLQHVSGGHESGEYPLPDNRTPQETGSAITYARRYTLCAVTGVAPESDDDDGAAASQRPQREQWDEAKPAHSPAAVAILAEQITAATKPDELRDLWQTVNKAGATGEIAGTEAAQLKSRITKRGEEIGPGEGEPT